MSDLLNIEKSKIVKNDKKQISDARSEIVKHITHKIYKEGFVSSKPVDDGVEVYCGINVIDKKQLSELLKNAYNDRLCINEMLSRCEQILNYLSKYDASTLGDSALITELVFMLKGVKEVPHEQ